MRLRTCSSASRSRCSRSASSRRSTTSIFPSSSIFSAKETSGAYAVVSASAPAPVIARTKSWMRASASRRSRISSTTARYSRSSSAVCTRGGSSSGRSSTSTRRRPSDPVSGPRPRSRGAGPASVAAQRAARQTDDARRLGDRADVGIGAVVHRDEQDTLALGDVDGQRHGHVREDDGVFEGNQQKLRQRKLLHSIVDGTSTNEVTLAIPTHPVRPRADASSRVETVRDLLLAWYSQNGRDLPWRRDAGSLRDPRLRGHAPADAGRPRDPALARPGSSAGRRSSRSPPPRRRT